jgi:hypothetical protein
VVDDLPEGRGVRTARAVDGGLMCAEEHFIGGGQSGTVTRMR